MLAIAVITVSDRAHKKEYEDLSGPVIRDILFAGLGAEVTITVVPDEKKALQAAIRGNADKDYVITTGGTSGSKPIAAPTCAGGYEISESCPSSGWSNLISSGRVNP